MIYENSTKFEKRKSTLLWFNGIDQVEKEQTGLIFLWHMTIMFFFENVHHEGNLQNGSSFIILNTKFYIYTW